MGAGSSKAELDTSRRPSQHVRHHSEPNRPVKSKSKSSIRLPSHPQTPHPARSKSLSAKPSKGILTTSNNKETLPSPTQPHAFTVDDARYHWDPRFMPVPIDEHGRMLQIPSSSGSHNPLPVPPKDIFGAPFLPSFPAADPLQPPLTEYSRMPSIYTQPFVPVDASELKQMRKKKVRHERKSSLFGSGPSTSKSDPSESATSHSSASTTNPPPQVIKTNHPPDLAQTHGPPKIVRQRSRVSMDSPARVVLPIPLSKTKKDKSHRRFFSAIFSAFKSSKKDVAPAKSRAPPFIPPEMTMPAPHPVPPPKPPQTPRLPVALPPRPISPPFALAPRTQITVPPVRFYHPDDPHYGFTQFSPNTILYKKELYPTAEHLYQCMKFMPVVGKEGGDEKVVESIRSGSSYPKDAVLEARAAIGKARTDWKESRVRAMDEVLYLKFSQHPDLRAELVATHPAELILDSPLDPFWGVGADGKGRNEFGVAMMRVRDRLRRELGL